MDTLCLVPVMNTYNCDNTPYIEIQCERQMNIKEVALILLLLAPIQDK